MTSVSQQNHVDIAEKEGAKTHVRKRIRHACDSCRSSRTKCDGRMPCERCNETRLTCSYERQQKKRGKGSELYPLKKKKAEETGQRPITSNQTASPTDGLVEVQDRGGHMIMASSSPTSSTNSYENNHQREVAVYAADGGLSLDFHHEDIPLLQSIFDTPRRINAKSPLSTALFAETYQVTRPQYAHYPVLNPILDSLTFMPPRLAADLMEVYFSDTVYGVAPIIRKSSILSLHKPRLCTPALLYSFMLVAAHATDHPLMKATPTTRETIIAKLFHLAIESVRPLRFSGPEGGFLDDIVTYIHLGIVSSASEQKGASMRWWFAANGLARLLKFNCEHNDLDEESREEQRRTWWLLFLMDRHLALCYNRALFFAESECFDLYTPVDEEIWATDSPLIPAEADPTRFKGTVYHIVGSGLFGMYLPLMTVLGGITDLHFLELNKSIASMADVQHLRNVYKSKLDTLEASIEEYEPNYNGIYVVAWKEYCRCLIHVFHILLQGHWDPIDLLDNIETLMSDPSFDNCVHHSILAAKCIERILVVDSDLRLNPYFFGIQLLQAGFILLCIADKMEQNTNKEVRDACEVVVRAHEVCVVTLNTEYQRNFRQILRGTIQTMVVPGSDMEEARRRRREILGLYRWSAGGNGLAI
jgi:hypothetical protein